MLLTPSSSWWVDTSTPCWPYYPKGPTQQCGRLDSQLRYRRNVDAIHRPRIVRALDTDFIPGCVFWVSWMDSCYTKRDAISINFGNWLKRSSFSWKDNRVCLTYSLWEISGTIDILTPIPGVLQRTRSVGSRVQRLLWTGNDTPEMASSTEFLPRDWSPHTMIYGKET
jgi:hypothetical protein